jgi:hypothetical protein
MDVGAGASGQPVRVGASRGQVGLGLAASGQLVGVSWSVSTIMAEETPEGGCVSWRVSDANHFA